MNSDADFEERKRILFVDDQEDLCTLYENILTKEGFVVRTCLDGSECLQVLDEFLPDLIILDIMMPEVHGWEVARRIREDDRFNRTRIIIMSVKGMKQDEVTSIHAGADAHLVKPVSNIELVGTIKHLLRI